MKKYKLTGETKEIGGVTLHRIRALIDIPEHDVKAGDLGGWIEEEFNLSHDGAAWVRGEAWVSGKARVSGEARVTGKARITSTIDYITIGAIGSRDDTTTFYRGKDGKIYVSCGCFNGSIDGLRCKSQRSPRRDET